MKIKNNMKFILLLIIFIFASLKYDFYTIFKNDFYVISENLKVTLINCIIGILIGYLLAIFLGLIVFKYELLSGAIDVINIIIQNIPTIILFPIILTLNGQIELSKIIIISLTVMYPIYVNLIDQKATSQYIEFIDFTKTISTKATVKYFELFLSYKVNEIFDGLKIAVTYAFYTTITTEFLISEKGIGIYLRQAINNYQKDKLYLVTAIIVIISLGLVGIVEIIKSKVIAYD